MTTEQLIYKIEALHDIRDAETRKAIVDKLKLLNEALDALSHMADRIDEGVKLGGSIAWAREVLANAD